MDFLNQLNHVTCHFIVYRVSTLTQAIYRGCDKFFNSKSGTFVMHARASCASVRGVFSSGCHTFAEDVKALIASLFHNGILQ